MLPSALVELGDDHKKLFDKSSWGELPVSKALLARGDKLLRSLDKVIDPQRLLYVAGANLDTPSGIQIGAPGQFSYRETLDGDGRVPHELGLLEGVTTYWVDRGVHGDLAKHIQVLDAITELLQTGKTAVLPTAKPAKPRAARARGGWVDERRGGAARPGGRRDPRSAEARAPGGRTARAHAGGADPAREPRARRVPRDRRRAGRRGTRGARGGASTQRKPCPRRRRPPRPGRSSRSRSCGATSRRSTPMSTRSDTTRASCPSGRSSPSTRRSPASSEGRSTTRGASPSPGTPGAETFGPRWATSRSSPGRKRTEGAASSSSRGWADPARSTRTACAGWSTTSRSPSPRSRACERRAAS